LRHTLSRKRVMNDRTPIGPWIRRYLLEHMINDRNLSRNTQASYRDTLKLLLPFLSAEKRLAIDHLAIEDLSSGIVRQFLDHLENRRHCCGATRNLRLAAIHSLAKFIGMQSPEHLAWCAEVRSVPYKKTTQKVVSYLDKREMDALLKVPNRRTRQGWRDYALLLFLYNTGARAHEAAGLCVADLTFGGSVAARILGKGNKERACPLWPQTVAALKPLLLGLRSSDPVFRGRRNEPLTRFGIYSVVKVVARRASTVVDSLKEKQISPHTIRHTCAVHLLRGGVDINTIRAWLGHVSLDTTNIYAEVDIEMKAKALSHCEIDVGPTPKRWRREPDLMAFLKAL
jgi:integrase/recombinase XerD